MIFSVSIGMTMHYGSGTHSYAGNCQLGSHMFYMETSYFSNLIYVVRGLLVDRSLLCILWNFVFPSSVRYGHSSPDQKGAPRGMYCRRSGEGSIG